MTGLAGARLATPRPLPLILVRGVESGHHVHVFKEIAAPGAGEASVVGCTDRASQPGTMCRNVIEVDETSIKITIADTVITAGGRQRDCT